MAHAATIITVGDHTKGVGREGVMIALMAALTESTLRDVRALPEKIIEALTGGRGAATTSELRLLRPATSSSRRPPVSG